MTSGWRYRAASVLGTGVGTVLAFVVANERIVQWALTGWLPVVSRLRPVVLRGDQFTVSLLTTLVVVLAALLPVFKPLPRRAFDVLDLVSKRLLLASLALATVGYFDYTYRLPRSTLILTSAFLLASVPLWIVAVRPNPSGRGRTVVVGDTRHAVERARESIGLPVVGTVYPPRETDGASLTDAETPLADGGDGSGRPDDCLGGLSRLDSVIERYNPDTAVLAFESPNREEFFGALGTCYRFGITMAVPLTYADGVLTSADSIDDGVVEIDADPWDWQDYVFKRVFDVVFAVTGLVCLAPVALLVAVGVKLDSPGPVFYSQNRTSVFGGRFRVYKFRSMVDDAESETGATISAEDAGGVDARVTRFGRVLRTTHLDEIPQLWSVLVGDMSAVGPRPERPELETDFVTDGIDWQKRWFIKPGLTGLAQINGVTGHDPSKKLRHDVEYIRSQSLLTDFKIVVRQLTLVLVDVVEVLR
jgi:lipopolysaccharide/colanic/teichoic acid biosynthesis glycosyltransferase